MPTDSKITTPKERQQADEIKRLRQALCEIAEYHWWEWTPYYNPKTIAVQALNRG